MGRRFGFLLGCVVSLCLASPVLADQPTLNIFNWSDYIAPDTLEKFTKETGIKVNYDTYDSDESLEAKLAIGNTGYDIVVPTLSPFLARQIKSGFHQPIDRAKLVNYKNLDPEVMKKMTVIDPGNVYSIPWSVGTTGIAYNEELVRARMPDAPVDSLRLMFDPAVLAKFKDCGVSFLDSPNDTLPAALGSLGLNPDSHDPADLKKAFELMEKLRPFIRKFDSSGYINDLAHGDLCVVWGYSNDAMIAKRRAVGNVKVRFVVPKEGSQLYVDSVAIPKDAPHPDLALKFLDFMLRPEIAADQGNFLFIQTGNLAAKSLLKPEIASDPGIYPPADVMDRLYLVTIGSPDFDRQRTRGWTRIKANR
jgi:putrescine transport system substrate-binding protein